MPPTRDDRNLFKAEAPLPTPPASSAPLLIGQRARRPRAASSLDLGYRVLGGLGEVELRLPDEARVLGLRSAHASGVLYGLVAQSRVDDIDRDDLEARVAVGVEVVRSDHTLEAGGLGHLGPNLLAARHAVGVLDRTPDGGHQGVGGVVSLHGVTAEVVGAGEGFAEVRDRLLGTVDLSRVSACRRRVDVLLVARGLVDAVRGLDTVTASEGDVPADVLHLLARDADVLVVGAAHVDAQGARVLEAEQGRLEVAGLLLLVFRVLGDRAAQLLELRLERPGYADAEHRAVVQDADVLDAELLVHVVSHRRTLVVVSGDDAPVVVLVARPQILRVVAAARDVLGQTRVRVGRADHREVLRRGDRDLRFRDGGVVGPDHAEEGFVVQHLADVVDAGVGVVGTLPAVVEALVRDRVTLDASGGVLLVDRELDAVGGRLAADRTNREVGADLDLALGSSTTGRTAAGERNESRRCEDYQSPSSNHMVPPCACWEANAQTTPHASHHLPPSSQLEVGARVRRRRVRPHGMAELLLRGKLSTRRAPQVKSKLRPASAWGRDQ